MNIIEKNHLFRGKKNIICKTLDKIVVERRAKRASSASQG
jgi:hypothetical protein